MSNRMETRVEPQERMETVVTAIERFEVAVEGPPGAAGAQFIVDATPEEIEAAPDGTVFLTTEG